MKLPKITAGEWRYATNGGLTIVTDKAIVIDVDDRLSPTEADAKLISASKDMLKALVAVAEWEPTWGSLPSTTRSKILSALEKAGVEL